MRLRAKRERERGRQWIGDGDARAAEGCAAAPRHLVGVRERDREGESWQLLRWTDGRTLLSDYVEAAIERRERKWE